MGYSLGPTLADILMTAFEDEIFEPLISSDITKFYGRIVDDTLVLIKPSDIYQQYYSNSILFIHFRTLFTAGELNVAISRVLTTKHSFGSRVWLE
jgi:hypothetical protein